MAAPITGPTASKKMAIDPRTRPRTYKRLLRCLHSKDKAISDYAAAHLGEPGLRSNRVLARARIKAKR